MLLFLLIIINLKNVEKPHKKFFIFFILLKIIRGQNFNLDLYSKNLSFKVESNQNFIGKSY
jgi:hypothetical protein